MATFGNSEQFKLDFLFKKTLGSSAGFGVTKTPAGEAAGISKPKIIQNNVINQTIPTTAPLQADLNADTINSNYLPLVNGSPQTGDLKYISNTYSYIAKYTLKLQSKVGGYSYYYNSPSEGKNLLDSAIPFNYDIAGGTYNYTVVFNSSSIEIPPEGDANGNYPWVLDTDAGYLYFIKKDFPSNDSPKITFWRYEGTYGAGGGSSSGAVTGDLSSNGNLFIAGDTSLNSRLVVGSDVTINNRLVTLGDASLNGNLYVAGTITAGNYAANSIPSSAIIGGGSVISNFGNLTVSHLSPFDYTIDSNLFILETAVASGQNGNLNSTQVVYSTVDCSFSGNLSVGGDFIQSNIDSVFSTPSIYSASTTTTVTNISANTQTTLLANTEIIASNISSNIYTLPNVNVLLGNIYLPRQSNVTISANIPIGYDINMLVQNANIAYGNNTYSNVSNTFNASNTVVGANITIANFKLLHSIDSIKANCNYTFNNLTIPMGLNIAGTLNYKTPSDPTNANVVYERYYGNYNTVALAIPQQQIVANVTVPPYYMGNAISVYTPIAANVHATLTSAVSGNLTAGAFANVSYNLTAIYANIYQNTGTSLSNPWGNVTLSTTPLYGNFSFKNNGASNMIAGNILKANVYLTTGNVTFVPDICSATVIYVVKYYAVGSATAAVGANVRPGLTFNTPTITGNIGNIYLNGNTSTPNPSASFSSNVFYTGGTAASVTYASSLNTAVNVGNITGAPANYVNEVSSVLANNYNSIQVNIPQLSVVNADNYSIVYDTLIAGTDYSNIVANSFSYAANTTLNNSYNANIFLGNIIITNANFTSNINNYSSNIAIIGNVNITNLSRPGPGNLNALGHSGNINTFTLYSNPGFTTNNNTTTDIKLSTYGSTTALSAPTYTPLSGNLQLTKSTFYINSNLVTINVYDTANNYVSSIPSANITFTGTNITNSTFYGIKYGNVAINSNVYVQNVMGMINISNFTMPTLTSDMSYSLQAVMASNVTIPHTANIIHSKIYSNTSNTNTVGDFTYLENSVLNTNYTNYNFTNTNPYTSGYLDVNVLRVNKDLTVTGRMNVQNYTYKNIINTTVNNYQLIVSEDLSLNGNLDMSGVLTFPNNNNNKKIVLYDHDSTETLLHGFNFYGFGIDADVLRYQVPTGKRHIFYFGNLDSTTRTQIANTGITSPTYNATSDYRIKANVIPLSDTSFSVDLLKPVTYTNKSLGKQDIGFIADEVQEHFPFLVNGEKDSEEYQTLNYTGLIGLLTKEIQDLKKENKVLREKMENIEIRLSNM